MENLHTYVCGKSGFGKSTFLKNEIFGEITNRDRAIVFINVKQELADSYATGQALKRAMREVHGKTVDPEDPAGGPAFDLIDVACKAGAPFFA